MDYSSPGGIRSPFSPRVVSGRRPLGNSSQLSGKFGQADDLPVGDVIYKTPHMVLQSYGAPLPVTVTEALTFSRNEISARMSSSWCWLVWGRRVLAWPLAGGVARELTLPQTDLAHSADLVILLDNGQQMPSCIGVSPEGLVRWWPGVSQAAVFAETACELAGQECCELRAVAPRAAVLATTSRTLLLLTADERGSIVVRVLRGAGGLLGGLSRRVASLLFPSTPPSDAKLVGMIVFPNDSSNTCTAEGGDDLPWVALLSQRAELQLWCHDNLHTHSLQAALHAPQGEAGGVCVCVEAACAPAPRTLLLLLSAPAKPGDTRLALATISVEDPTAPRVTSLTGINAGAAGAGAGAGGRGPLRLLALQNQHLLYTPTTLTLLHRGELDLSGEGDSVVCASSAGNVAILLSHKHGVLRLTPGKSVPVESGAESPRASRLYDGNLAILEIDPDQLEATDAIGKLKLALLHHVRGSTAACRALLSELAGSPTADAGSSPELARCVLTVAAELLDDMPCGDPRWPREEGGGSGAASIALGASSALQLQQQMRDKRRVLRLLCDMLHSQLPTNAGGAGAGGGGGAALWAGLAALDELVALGLALRRLQPAHAAAVEHALYVEAFSGGGASAAERAALAAGRLAPADVCYRRLTALWRVLPRLQDPAVLAAALRAARAGRGAWPAEPPPRAALLAALVDSLQRYITGRGGSGDADSPEPGPAEPGAGPGAGAGGPARAERALAAAQLVLSDAARLPTHKWHRLRRQLIDAFLEVGARELAAILAEKFGVLELLVSLCVEDEDLDRLYTYMDKYSAQGIEPLAAEGVLRGSGKLRAQFVRSAPSRAAGAGAGGGVGGGAARLLAGEPALLALWLLRGNALGHAADALMEASGDLKSRAHVTASLAKLCLLASDEAGSEAGASRLAAVEARLQLCEQQAGMAGDVLLSPDELVQVFLDSDPSHLTEYDYKKALDVAELIEEEDIQAHFRLKVFMASILRDTWSDGVEALDDYMFCKLLQLLQLTCTDVYEIVPRREDLLRQTALASLAEHPHFRFLLRHAYENIHPDEYTQ